MSSTLDLVQRKEGSIKLDIGKKKKVLHVGHELKLIKQKLQIYYTGQPIVWNNRSLWCTRLPVDVATYQSRDSLALHWLLFFLIPVFWDVTLCRWVCSSRRFGKVCLRKIWRHLTCRKTWLNNNIVENSRNISLFILRLLFDMKQQHQSCI
jgi:hypothetical protein